MEAESEVGWTLSDDDILRFIFNSLRKEQSAIRDLEYELLGLHSEYSHADPVDTKLILDECRGLGIYLLHTLKDIGCYENGLLKYIFAERKNALSIALMRDDLRDYKTEIALL